MFIYYSNNYQTVITTFSVDKHVNYQLTQIGLQNYTFLFK